MNRLTYRLKDQYGNPTDEIIVETDYTYMSTPKKQEVILSRLAAIEDILGDEYDLDELKEMVQAKREGRCVVLDGKSRDKELIRKLVRLFCWLEDCVKKKDFSPFRIVAGAPENNYPFISAFQHIENEYELEIHLAGKDEEAEAARREQDEA